MIQPILEVEIPYLTTEQMVEVDRAMLADYKIELLQMMENAGRNLAHLARRRFLDGDPRRRKVVVLAGTGGNGGGGLVCARRLHNFGAHVTVIISRNADRFTGVPAHQLDILRRMLVPIFPVSGMDRALEPELIIDGLIGYSLKGAPRGATAELIQWANAQSAPILALDAPSGLDTTSGMILEPAIRAAATMTLALPKEGLRSREAGPVVGELYLADISVPPSLYAKPPLGLKVGPIFAESDILRLR